MNSQKILFGTTAVLALTVGTVAQGATTFGLDATGLMTTDGSNPVATGTQTIAVVDADGNGYGDGSGGTTDLTSQTGEDFLFDNNDWIITGDSLGQWDEGTGVELFGTFQSGAITSDVYSFVPDDHAGVDVGDDIYVFFFPGLDVSESAPGVDQDFGVFQAGTVAPDPGSNIYSNVQPSIGQAEYTTLPEPASAALVLLGMGTLASGRFTRNRRNA
jgi:hypothetical protein